MKVLSKIQIEAVSGGFSQAPDNSARDMLQDELLRYKTGLSNMFGINPDQQLPDGNPPLPG